MKLHERDFESPWAEGRQPAESPDRIGTLLLVAMIVVPACCIAVRIYADSTNEALVHSRTGRDLELGGQFEDALVEYREALELEPRAYDVHFSVARALVEMERYEQARESILTGMDLRAEVGAEELDQGESDSGLHHAWLDLGECELALDRPGAALRAYEEAQAILETDLAECGLARSLSRLGRFDEAEAVLASSIRPRPFVRPYLTWAEILEQRGERELAIEKLRAAADALPASSEVRYRLALLLERAGRPDEPREDLRAALAVWDDDIRVDRPSREEIRRVLVGIEPR